MGDESREKGQGTRILGQGNSPPVGQVHSGDEVAGVVQGHEDHDLAPQGIDMNQAGG